MRQRALHAATGWPPAVQHLGAEVGQERVGRQRAVPRRHRVGQRVKSPPAASSSAMKAGPVVARRHRHVRHHLPGAPALAQRRCVPHRGVGRLEQVGQGEVLVGDWRRVTSVSCSAAVSSSWSSVLGLRPAATTGRDRRRSGRARTGTRPGPRGRGTPRARRSGGSAPRCDRGRARRTRCVTRMPECDSVHDSSSGSPHLVVDRTRRVLAAVGVVDHHRLEHAAGPGVDRDAVRAAR